MKMLHILVCITSLMLLTACDEPITVDSSRSTTICELLSQGATNDRRRVRLNAIYQTDEMHYAGISDPNCAPSLISTAVIMEDVRDVRARRDRASLLAIDAAVGDAYAEIENPNDLVFEVDVSGVFLWQTGDPPGPGFIIEKVWSYRAEPRADR